MSVEAYCSVMKASFGSPKKKHVMLVLADMAGSGGDVFPDLDGLAEKTEIRQDKLMNILHKLDQRGCINMQNGNGGIVIKLMPKNYPVREG